VHNWGSVILKIIFIFKNENLTNNQTTVKSVKIMPLKSAISWTTIVVHSRDDEGLGVSHEVNHRKISHRWWWGRLSDQPKMLSRSCYRILKNYSVELTNWCKCNLTMAKVTGFCSMLLQPERCLLPYCCTCNAFFMDQLPPLCHIHCEKCWFCGRHVMASVHNGYSL